MRNENTSKKITNYQDNIQLCGYLFQLVPFETTKKSSHNPLSYFKAFSACVFHFPFFAMEAMKNNL